MPPPLPDSCFVLEYFCRRRPSPPLLRAAHGVAPAPPPGKLSGACGGCSGCNPSGGGEVVGAATEVPPVASRASDPTCDGDDPDVEVATEDSRWGAAAPLKCMRRTDHSGNCTAAGGAPAQRSVAAVGASPPGRVACASARARDASPATASAAKTRDTTSASPMLQSLMVPSTPAVAMAEQHGEKSTESTASRWPRSPGCGKERVRGPPPALAAGRETCWVAGDRGESNLWDRRKGQL
jgi:hypothetical protein